MEDSRDPSKDPESDVYPEVYGRSVIWHYFSWIVKLYLHGTGVL